MNQNTKRHQQIPEDIWKASVAKLEIDDQGKKSMYSCTSISHP